MKIPKRKSKIVFVCRGNIHRSVIAEKILKKILKNEELENRFEVISRGLKGSAGTEPPKHKNITGYPKELEMSSSSLEKLGIDITQHESKPIIKEVVADASVIFAFDKKTLEDDPIALVKQFPEFRHKIHLLTELDGEGDDIPDCYGVEDAEFHRKVIERINDILSNHWNKLLI